MGEIIDLAEAREERLMRSAREMRLEMDHLCSDLQQAIGKLEAARAAVYLARQRIDQSRTRMERVHRVTAEGSVRRRRVRLLTV